MSGPVIYFVHAYLSRTASPLRIRAPGWVRRGSQLVQTIFLGVASKPQSVLALNLLLGYLVIPRSPTRPMPHLERCSASRSLSAGRSWLTW